MSGIEKTIPVGLDELHIAVMTDEVAETYDTPEKVAGAIQANVTPNVNSTNLFADNKLWDTADALGAIAMVLGAATIPTPILAKILGHSIDSNGVLVRKNTDRAPYVAVGYRREMANGKKKFVWNLKGKFRLEEQNADTKTDTPTFQTPTINATFMPRDTDGQWQSQLTEGDEGVDATVLANWFDEVYLETPEA